MNFERSCSPVPPGKEKESQLLVVICSQVESLKTQRDHDIASLNNTLDELRQAHEHELSQLSHEVSFTFDAVSTPSIVPPRSASSGYFADGTVSVLFL